MFLILKDKRDRLPIEIVMEVNSIFNKGVDYNNLQILLDLIECPVSIEAENIGSYQMRLNQARIDTYNKFLHSEVENTIILFHNSGAMVWKWNNGVTTLLQPLSLEEVHKRLTNNA